LPIASCRFPIFKLESAEKFCAESRFPNRQLETGNRQ